jgi:outer membrane lipoprotein SlyB
MIVRKTERNLRGAWCIFAASALLVLGGCASPGYRDYGRGGYGGDYRGGGNYACAMCGTVESVQQVYTDGSSNSGTLGTIIGAVIGAAAGNQVGKGDGRKAATVGGAVAGGVIGHQIGQRNGGEQTAWRVAVRLTDGRYATVTQRDMPDARVGDYVEVRNNRVYRR